MARKKGSDISAEISELKKHQIEEVRQYSETQILILSSRLRVFDARNKCPGRRLMNVYEKRKTEKELEAFTALRSKMAELL